MIYLFCLSYECHTYCGQESRVGLEISIAFTTTAFSVSELRLVCVVL